MADDGVRERHGVVAGYGHVTLVEESDGIKVFAVNSSANASAVISPQSARRLASQLRRLARRYEERAKQ